MYSVLESDSRCISIHLFAIVSLGSSQALRQVVFNLAFLAAESALSCLPPRDLLNGAGQCGKAFVVDSKILNFGLSIASACANID